MKKVGFVVLFLFFIIGIGTTIWFLNQEIDEGYVYAGEESSIWIVEIEPEKMTGKSQAEIIEVLDEEADPYEDAIYDIPMLNRLIGTEFEEGDKVKIYWGGGPVFQSAPALIKDTSLMIKAND